MNKKNYYVVFVQDIFRAIKPHPEYWRWAALRLIYVITDVFPAIVIGQVVNILSRDTIDISALWFYGAALAFIMLIGPVIEIITSYYSWNIAQKIGLESLSKTVKKFRASSFEFWEVQNKGKIQQIINEYVEALGSTVARISHTYLRYVGYIIGIVIASSFLSPVLVGIFAINFLLFLWNLRYSSQKEITYELREVKEYEKVNSLLFQYLQSFSTIVYLNLFSRQEKGIQKHLDIYYQKYTQREIVSMWKWYRNNALNLATLLIVFIYSVSLIIQGVEEPGFLLTAMLFATRLVDIYDILVNNVTVFVSNVARVQRYHETIGTLPAKYSSTSKLPLFEYISYDNVSFEKDGVVSLLDLTVSIKSGQKIAICGASGSGKSTMIDLFLKVRKPTKGRITFNTIPYDAIEISDLANVVSIVPQEVQLFNTSIQENIILDKEYDRILFDKVLKDCRLQDFVNSLPDRADTLILEDARNISGGEKQRIGIARALYQQQQILILDEASAALDPENERAVMDAILQSYPHLTVLYITHKYALLNQFDNILVFENSVLVEQGNFDHLRDEKGVFWKLYQASLTS